MKSVLYLLAFLPFLCHAQDASKQQKEEMEKTNAAVAVRSDGKLKFVSANTTTTRPAVKKDDQRKKLKDDIVHTGDVKFQVGGNTITCDSAVEYTNEDKVMAYNVKITNPASFVIKGGELNFNRGNASALLQKDISVTAMNGELVGTSELLNADFSYEIYRVSGSIKDPKDPSNKKK